MDVEVKVHQWRLTYLNTSGVYMAGLYLLLQILSTFMLFDLSALYDLKRFTVEMGADMLSLVSDNDENDEPTNLVVEGSFTFCGVIIELFSNFDTRENVKNK